MICSDPSDLDPTDRDECILERGRCSPERRTATTDGDDVDVRLNLLPLRLEDDVQKTPMVTAKVKTSSTAAQVA